MPHILLVAPFFDLPTGISFSYAEELITLFEDYGATYDRLRAFFATQFPLRLKLRQKPKMLVYAGHAFEEILVGQIIFPIPFFSPLVGLSNAHLLEDMIVVCIPACLNGQTLGPMAVGSGVRSWFGSLDYMYAAFPEADRDYLADFKAHWRTVPEALLKGQTTGQAFEAYLSKGNELLQLYRSHLDRWDNADEYMFQLGQNTTQLRLFGDPNAVFWE